MKTSALPQTVVGAAGLPDAAHQHRDVGARWWRCSVRGAPVMPPGDLPTRKIGSQSRVQQPIPNEFG